MSEHSEIKCPSIWAPSDGIGPKVLVENVLYDDDTQAYWVRYGWVENNELKHNEKSLLVFLERYYRLD